MRTVRTLRVVVTVLVLAATAAFGMFTATGFLTLAVAVGGSGGWDALLRDMALQGAGFSALCVAPAVAALWLRARRPVASGTIAALVGAMAVCVCGPHADGSTSSALVAWAGLLLMVCAVPLPSPGTGDRFAG